MLPKPLLLTLSGLVLAIMASSVGLVHAATSWVQLVVDGVGQRVVSLEKTVGDVLQERGIKTGEHDDVAPALHSKLASGMDIHVRYGRQVTVSINGEKKTVWTTATNVNDVMEQLQLTDPNLVMSVSRSASIGREGLNFSADKQGQVTIKSIAGEKQLTAHGTVADAVKMAGLTLGVEDRVVPALNAPVSDGLVITITKTQTKEITKDVAVPFKKTTREDESMKKGEKKVSQEGVEGAATEIWVERYENGELVDSVLKNSTVTKEPVDEITIVGTKKPVYTGSHADWMSAAGIAADDFDYVEKLIQRESGWRPDAVNSSSGACGLVQALPCSKLGPNWNDPVVALKWGDSYVKNRYGGWSGAWAHSQSAGWY